MRLSLRMEKPDTQSSVTSTPHRADIDERAVRACLRSRSRRKEALRRGGVGRSKPRPLSLLTSAPTDTGGVLKQPLLAVSMQSVFALRFESGSASGASSGVWTAFIRSLNGAEIRLQCSRIVGGNQLKTRCLGMVILRV